MCGKVISGGYYEQINSFGGGIFQTDSKFFITNRIAGTQKRPRHRPDGSRTTPRTVFERISGQPADRTVFEPSARTDSGLSSEPISGAFPKEFQTAIRRGFRPAVRTNPGPLPGGISGRHPGQISGCPDGFRTVIRTNHNSDAPPPRKSHRKAGGIPGGATCGRNRLIRTSGSAAPPTCIRLSAPVPRRTRARK